METTRFALIQTGWGVAAVLCTEAGVSGLVWPQRSKKRASYLARQRAPGAEEIPPGRAPGGVARKLADYFSDPSGRKPRTVDFTGVPVDLSSRPAFHARVLRALHKVGYGQTVSYSQLARRVGKPGAARAVGQAMANNPIPVILPCHRVLRSDGGLGGFSADEGVALKRRMLEMEQQACGR